MFDSQFFVTNKRLKELFLLIEIKNNVFITKTQLSCILNITPAMISRYISVLESNSLLITEKYSQKDYQYRLTDLGIKYLNEIMKLYIKDISQLKALFQTHINKFQREYQIKVAITNSFGTLTPYLAKQLGFFEKNQINIDLVEYDNGEKIMEDFEKNKFDIVLLGSVPAYLWKTYGTPINVIASVDCGSHALIVKNNSCIQSISDLKGKTVIIPENTTVTSNIFRIFIKKHSEYKVDYDNDLNIVNVEINKIEEAFIKNDVDALIAWEPYVSILLSKYNDLKILYDFSSLDNNYLSNVIGVNEEFYSIYKEILNRFIDVLNEVIDYYKDNATEVNKIISKKLIIPVNVVEMSSKRTKFIINKLI